MKVFARGLFIILFAELSMGGGGRLLAVGPVTLRMILFIVACCVTVLLLRKIKIPREYKYLLLAFSALLVIGTLVGILNGAGRANWWEDVKPLLYFFILPFFWIATDNPQSVKDATSIVRISSVLQSVLFFLALILIHSGVVPFLDFYHKVIVTGEFFFRGEMTFFYKGFLYLCVGLIFFSFSDKKFKTVYLLIISLAILASFTRGFVFALSLTFFVFFAMNKKWASAAFIGLVAVASLFFSNLGIENLSKIIDRARNGDHVTVLNPNEKLLGDRNVSDVGRTKQVKEVFADITQLTLLIGHGFGIGIPSRPVHMEISYLEIFHKQGILGLAFWGVILFLLFEKYQAAGSSKLRDAFFCSGLFVFFQSLTNQFVNNPIGLSLVLLSVVCLDRMNAMAFSESTDSNQKSTAFKFRTL